MKYLAALLLLPALTPPGHALDIRAYNSALHDRFTGYPFSTVMNPAFLYDASKFTGVGWNGSEAYKQFALISPQHFVCASHPGAPPAIGHNLRFIDSNGNLVQRQITALASIPADDLGNTDLMVGTLAAAVPSSVVKPLAWLNLPTEGDYAGHDLVVFGYGLVPGVVVRAGHGTIEDFGNGDVDGSGTSYGTTRLMRFIYEGSGTDPNDAHFIGGDSGSPTFVMQGGQPALVGIHYGVNPVGSDFHNYDTFIPPHVPKVDLLLSGSGYRMRPAIFTPTTLALTSGSTPANLQSGASGSVNLTVGNTGAETTGNLTVTVSFPLSLAPSSITSAGCVVESVSTGVWQVRKAVVAAAENVVITAAWPSVPNTSELTATVAVESDTTTTSTHPLSIPVAQTYASWSQGLSEAGEADDPDDDGEVNLLEYAFGSPPSSGSHALPGGVLPFPVLMNQAGTVTLSYPERTQAALLGLSYAVETTTDPAQPSWPLSLPVGAVTSTQPYVPAIPGFVKRTLTWPADGPRKLARVRVELAE
ncbi:hypothetical protein OJ996_06590 [Luteolibacter sp. GHJ8]|uniref:CARDB protein n=1 Tax=Luteolibacter rhizosphaerae TaxID=2989719 RepID=A0ABT3G068_9BACT|nr:hypothetical protein [Luteolibacter rhizosphaerae]MCW1913230.1 hypothetical protein [Luteolibacter rhizosphaerae]